jgi:5-methylthioadenosine/S-adenosylhomocysteine deaminase
MYDLLIQNVMVVDPQGDGVAVLPGLDIAVAGQRIAALLPAGQVAPDVATEVIDSGGMVALPGLINTHAHAAMTLFRGAAEDVPVEEWFND